VLAPMGLSALRGHESAPRKGPSGPDRPPIRGGEGSCQGVLHLLIEFGSPNIKVTGPMADKA